MERVSNRINRWGTNLSVGFFLALRQVRRSAKSTTLLIIFVMTLTFLNLVVVRGILVGLLQGSTDVYVETYSGDILISNLSKKHYIENSPAILEIVRNMPWVEYATPRYMESGTLEAGYKERIRLTDDPNLAGGVVAGIDPEIEDLATDLSSKVIEGSYLTPDDADGILIGANLLKKYLPFDIPGFPLLENVEIGDRVRLQIGENTKEVIVKGVVRAKSDFVDMRIFTLDRTLRPLIGRGDFNVDEIAIKLKPGVDPYFVKDALLAAGVGETARVQTWQESLPKFLLDIQDTFSLLGNVMGSISIVVASITIFIVVFINAITRRKFIGILKGIGISPGAIEISYIFQSVFYALLGTGIGLMLLYGLMVPFFKSHPINFPFSDGILVAEVAGTFVRALLIVVATVIAGFIPARLVVKKNTLDSILGR